jgi:hypothetical protein
MMRRRRGGVARTVGRTAVVAGTATAVAGGVGRRQSKKQAAQQEEQAAAQQTAYDQGQADAQPAPPAATPAAGDDMMSQLEKLGQLHDQGVLTDAEFEAQKAKLLAG